MWMNALCPRYPFKVRLCAMSANKVHGNDNCKRHDGKDEAYNNEHSDKTEKHVSGRNEIHEQQYEQV
jgi:hypothetical protein